MKVGTFKEAKVLSHIEPLDMGKDDHFKLVTYAREYFLLDKYCLLEKDIG